MASKPHFDIKKKNKYIGKWCLFRKCWEVNYNRIFVIDISEGMIKYKYPSGYEVIQDANEFNNVEFFESPFKDDKEDFEIE